MSPLRLTILRQFQRKVLGSFENKPCACTSYVRYTEIGNFMWAVFAMLNERSYSELNLNQYKAASCRQYTRYGKASQRCTGLNLIHYRTSHKM